MAAEWAAEEMSGARLRDRRRVRSVIRITAAIVEQPHRSLSCALGPAVRQAAHRIFEHEGTSVAKLIAGHVVQTGLRCREHERVLIPQDTTVFVYGQEKIVGLGMINGSTKRGLLGHSALAVTPQGTPLGVLSLQLWGATPEDDPDALRGKPIREDRESYKWTVALQEVAAALPAETQAVLIADRESDVFEYLSQPRPPNLDLLVRACQDRTVEYGVPEEPGHPTAEARTERGKLFEVAAGAPVVGRYRATVPRQSARPGRPAREARAADLELRATEVKLQPPRSAGRGRAPVTVWVVQGLETDPPDGVEPIRWVLLTTVPITDAAGATQTIVDYTRRWIIERLHYTLKSGLLAEKLQIDDALSLSNCLALYYVAAWRLLYVTHLARETPHAPATTVLEPVEVKVLQRMARRPVATIAQAVTAIAILGGHEPFKNGPPPGVKVMWHGFQRLDAFVMGWTAAMEEVGRPEL